MPVALRPAASVLLHREGPQGIEIFWVRRGEKLRFAGGFYAFPGGRVDAADASLPLEGKEGLGAEEMACIAAAARELFEETGVLVAAGADRVPAEARMAAREALLRREAPRAKEGAFADFLASHGLRIDARSFTPAGRWITPPAMPIRFDARFYLAPLPPGERADVWPGELVDGEWIRPAVALWRWRVRGGCPSPLPGKPRSSSISASIASSRTGNGSRRVRGDGPASTCPGTRADISA